MLELEITRTGYSRLGQPSSSFYHTRVCFRSLDFQRCPELRDYAKISRTL
jgi:hypothetical protein